MRVQRTRSAATGNIHATSAYRFRVVAFCLGACLLSSGCGPSHGWGVAGEGGTNYEFERLSCDGRVFLVVAANGCSGGSSSGEAGSFRGQLHARDGREIAWTCSTKDGTDGTVTVDGQRFDLSKGALFLVSTSGKTTKLEQIAVDMSKLQGHSTPDHPFQEKLEALGSAQPPIAAFFKESQTGK
jgi:hypothetical protein